MADFVPADARENGRAFSNSTQYEIWAAGRGCYTCRNDDDATEKYCPILSSALQGGIPSEWTAETHEDWIHGNYVCSNYDERPDDDGPDDGDDPEPDPGPPPVIEGQIDMFEVFAEAIADEASTREVAHA